jgi:hypothetical protein
MTIFRIQVFQRLDSSDREWSNTWLCDAADIDTVVAGMPDFGDVTAQAHLDNVIITRARVSDILPDTDVFSIVTLGVIGTRGTGGDNDWLPLFNTVRVDFDVAGGGRPSRKYFRSPILEADQQAGQLADTVVTYFTTVGGEFISTASGGSFPLVDPDGQLLTAAHCQTQVQMRQLHRKRKKAVAP